MPTNGRRDPRGAYTQTQDHPVSTHPQTSLTHIYEVGGLVHPPPPVVPPDGRDVPIWNTLSARAVSEPRTAHRPLPTDSERLRVRIRRVPEGVTSQLCHAPSGAGKRTPPPTPLLGPRTQERRPVQAPPSLPPTHSTSACLCALFFVFVGLFGGLLGVCGLLGV